MPLADGTRLEHFEIVEPLGAGGMGEVYRAVDTKLRREVAIKILPPKFAADPSRLARFEREAHLLAALNHPNIATIYGLEHVDGIRFLVLELVEGQTLSERLKSGPMEAGEALGIAAQIAEALEAAHEKGVVHRDLKPGNVKITPAGKVKVLDFGLAKALGDPEPAPASSNSEPHSTVTLQETKAGVVMGTAAYMSPEQAEGKPTDKRSDVWSFGVVLYEMLSGKPCFDGKTTTHVMLHVLEQEPDWEKLPGTVPVSVRQLLERCLTKDPAMRLRDIGDLRLQLQAIKKASASGIAPVPGFTRQSKSWLWPAVTAALVVALGVTAWMLWPKPAAPARTMRFQVKIPDNVIFTQFLSVSPDGRKLVFVSAGDQSGLWIHDLDTLEWRRLAGTERGSFPFWSPDSRFLGFSVQHEIKKIEVAGGPPQTLCSIPNSPGTGAWNRDGVIVFGAVPGPIRRVSAAGGIPTELTALDRDLLHSQPTFLPDGKHFLYLRSGTVDAAGIYVGSVDAKPADQSRERILATTFGAPYVDGNLFFMRDGTLMAQPFDAGRLQLRGEPVPVAEHVAALRLNGIFSVSPTGVLAYRTGTAAAGLQPTWFDRQGKQEGSFGERGPDQGFALSPDGTRAAVRDASPSAVGDIWRLDFERGVRTRLTFRQSYGSFPVWSPDGSRIIFAAGDTLDTLYEKTSSGVGEEKVLFKKPGIKIPTSWSRDGRFLLYHTNNVPKTGTDLWVLPLEGDRKPVLLLGTEFAEFDGSFSPDMRWIAYTSDESGRDEIYVRPFTASGLGGPSLSEGKWQVSKDGGRLPRWRTESREVVFRAINGSPMAVDVNGTGAAFQAGVPKQLFAAPANVGDWDVTADGKRFLVGVPPGGQTADEPITVILNWQASLKK
jgi:eukaryotic-like serine/threonine-protein kinase